MSRHTLRVCTLVYDILKFEKNNDFEFIMYKVFYS